MSIIKKWARWVLRDDITVLGATLEIPLEHHEDVSEEEKRDMMVGSITRSLAETVTVEERGLSTTGFRKCYAATVRVLK